VEVPCGGVAIGRGHIDHPCEFAQGISILVLGKNPSWS
jgi:hypothetical protein